jgi:dihydrofolate synthase/folylpolyglutamate synthase
VNYREALAWLYGTQRFGIKLGLENAQRLFAALGVAHTDARVIHVAGTNGKGSVCAMAAAICTAQAYRTGLFTSPHLITFRERIRVGDKLIAESQVATGLGAIRELVREWNPHPTFFEITTALALLHFQQERCEVVVLETGMGGRLDATNAITATASVITPIDYDHQAWLGDTLEKIAGEKAGIIKPRVPVVSAKQQSAAAAVIRRRAAECDAPLAFIDAPTGEFRIALAGSHQQENAALAIAALRAAEITVDNAAIARGLASVEWPARFQRVRERLVVDGAHNGAGARVLAATWREAFANERPTMIAGMLSDKDANSFWRTLAPLAARVFLPCFRTERAMPPGELRGVIGNIAPQLELKVFDSLAEAIGTALRYHEPVLITGSLHLAGEALATLRGEPAAFEECAQ